MTEPELRATTRRAYLRRSGAVLGAVAVAGCSEGTDGREESDPEPPGTSAPGESPAPTGASSPPAGASSPTAGNTPAPTKRTSREDSGETATAPTAEPATPTDRATEPASTPTSTPIHADYETTEVRATTPDGELLGSVTAAIADTPSLRYLGLSDTESLPEDRGMLFVYDDVDDRTFVMRRMDFGIDIVYADDEGVVTRVHHAPAPGPDEDGNDQRYPGRGQYVLEVNYEWTTDHGVETGDVLRFDL